MKQKEDRKRWAEFSDGFQHLVDEYGFFIKKDQKKRRFSEEDQIEELKRKRFRTPHEL